MSTDKLTPWSVLRDGVRLIARFVRVHPAAFTIAVFGAAVYAGAIIGSSVVMGWVTDVVIIPVLEKIRLVDFKRRDADRFKEIRLVPTRNSIGLK